MANSFKVPSDPEVIYTRLDEKGKTVKSATENYGLNYSELVDSKRIKLNRIFEEVNNKASIDYSKQEILDIKTAVHTMVERMAARVNERGSFKISRIEPCGSMAEQTAVLKFSKRTRERYTGLIFLLSWTILLKLYVVITAVDNVSRLVKCLCLLEL